MDYMCRLGNSSNASGRSNSEDGIPELSLGQFFILTPLFIPSSVYLSYLIVAVTTRKCLGKHSGMSYTFN